MPDVTKYKKITIVYEPQTGLGCEIFGYSDVDYKGTNEQIGSMNGGTYTFDITNYKSLKMYRAKSGDVQLASYFTVTLE